MKERTMYDIPTVYEIMVAIMVFARDLLLLFAPIIGLLAGMKMIGDWIHRALFSRKV